MNDVGTVWCVSNVEAEEAFERVQEYISKDAMQALDMEWGEYVLFSDSIKYAVKQLLSQNKQDQETRVIPGWSKKLKCAEKRYRTYNRELLAICNAVVTLHYHLYLDKHFTIHMDRASLRHILIHPQLTVRHMEYSPTLSNFLYNFRYIPGMRNPVADTL